MYLARLFEVTKVAKETFFLVLLLFLETLLAAFGARVGLVHINNLM